VRSLVSHRQASELRNSTSHKTISTKMARQEAFAAAVGVVVGVVEAVEGVPLRTKEARATEPVNTLQVRADASELTAPFSTRQALTILGLRPTKGTVLPTLTSSLE